MDSVDDMLYNNGDVKMDIEELKKIKIGEGKYIRIGNMRFYIIREFDED